MAAWQGDPHYGPGPRGYGPADNGPKGYGPSGYGPGYGPAANGPGSYGPAGYGPGGYRPACYGPNGYGPGVHGPGGIPPQLPGPGSFPEQAKWIRVAGFICYALALVTIVVIVVAVLSVMVITTSGPLGTESAFVDLFPMLALLGLSALLMMVPLLICSYLLAKRPTLTMAVTVTALAGLRALLAVGQLFDGGILTIHSGLLSILAVAVALSLLWGRHDSRAFLLGVR